MPTENTELIPAKEHAPTGFVTQVREHGLSPALLAEQQRAKSEIEAALQLAAARPRDQKEAMDRILTSCQRPGLAAKAKYRYNRGGTEIAGVTIDLMEVVAQNWGNLDFGFRELARFPGSGGGAGESVVEAFAWDLETNVKRRVQFTVQHQERTKKGTRLILDPRDIYEWVANQAQRRVRTCLENIVPRDIYEAAGDECEKTMTTHVGDMKAAIAGLLPAFAPFGVTKEMLEARLQRRLETISPAQVVYLRTVWTGLRDGISHPEDWFDMSLGQAKTEEKAKPAAEQAKEKMRAKQQTPKAEAAAPSKITPPAAAPVEDAQVGPLTPPTEAPVVVESEPESLSQPVTPGDLVAELIEDYKYEVESAETLTGLRELRKHAEASPVLQESPDGLSLVLQMISQAEEKIRASRGPRSNK